MEKLKVQGSDGRSAGCRVIIDGISLGRDHKVREQVYVTNAISHSVYGFSVWSQASQF